MILKNENCLFITPRLFPSRTANSIHVMKMCHAFAKNGHEVILFSPYTKSDQESGVTDDFSYYGVEPIFQTKKL